MYRLPLCGLVSIVAVSVLGARCAEALEPAHGVKTAIKKLAEQESYSWTSVRESEGSDSGSVKGRIQKDGLTYLSIKMADRSVEGVLKGSKGAIKTDDGWKATDEFTGSGGSPRGNPMTFLARHLSTFGKSPVDQATGLLKETSSIKSEKEGVYHGKLSDEGVKQNVPQFGVEVSNTDGSVKFWVRDGMLVKYAYTVRAKVKFVRQQREVDYDRTTTVEIKDAGSTKVEVSPDALAKLE